jgi:O-acetylhomoserine/O-acetylserine sulfhydrylase-like pyridoxal-dependent enzyme
MNSTAPTTYRYSRIANPTTDVLERRVAALAATATDRLSAIAAE